MSPRTNWFDLPDHGEGRMPSLTARMSSLDFTRTLTEPKSLTGKCHCGNEGLLNAVYEPAARGGMRLAGYHCWLCRCDEHTPQAHAAWDGRRKDSSFSASTPMPGCGRRCSRGETDILAGSKFPTFREWARINGQKALREAARS